MCDVTKAIQQLACRADRVNGGPGKAELHIAVGKFGDVPMRLPVVLAELSDGTVLPLFVGWLPHMDVRPWDDERDTENQAAAMAMLRRLAAQPQQTEAQRQPIGFVHTGSDTVN